MPYNIDEERGDIRYEVYGDKLVLKVRDGLLGTEGGQEIYIIKENDGTKPSDKNVLSAKRTLYEISKIISNDSSLWEKAFEIVSVNGKDTIKAKLDFWGVGSVSARGIGSGGQSGGGSSGASALWQLVDVQPETKDAPIGSIFYKKSETHWGYQSLSSLLTGYATTKDLDGYMKKSDFDDLFEIIEVDGVKIVISKNAFVSKSSITARYANGISGGSGNTSALYQLVDVLEETKDAPIGSLLYKKSATHWGYIDQESITPDLTGYATESWVNRLGYATTRELTDGLSSKWEQDDTKISNWDTAFEWGDHSKAGYMQETKFDELFEVVEVGGKKITVSKLDFASRSSITARYKNGTPPERRSLGSLSNVGSWADEATESDTIMVRMAGAAGWTGKPLSEIVSKGLDETALGEYLTDGGYWNKSNSGTSAFDWSVRFLNLNANGVRSRFGALNNGNNEWFHFETNSTRGFYFGNKVSVYGDIFAGTNYNFPVYHAGNSYDKLMTRAIQFNDANLYHNTNYLNTTYVHAGVAGYEMSNFPDIYGQLINFSSADASLQIASTSGQNQVWIRSKWWTQTISSWNLLYHSGNSNRRDYDWYAKDLHLGVGASGTVLKSNTESIAFYNGFANVAKDIRVGGISVSDSYDSPFVPNGIFSKGSIQTNNVLIAYGYASSQTLPAIIMDKPGIYSFGIGPDGTNMRIRYGATVSINNATWSPNEDIVHHFVGHIDAIGGMTGVGRINSWVSRGGLEAQSDIVPGVSFHRPGVYGGCISMIAAGDFRFYQDNLNYADVTCNNVTTTGYHIAVGGWFQNDRDGVGLYNSARDARWYAAVDGWTADKRINAVDFYTTNWYRSYGNGGWYNELYNGGIHMLDSTWVRIYGGKRFYVDNNSIGFGTAAIHTAGGMYASRGYLSAAPNSGGSWQQGFQLPVAFGVGDATVQPGNYYAAMCFSSLVAGQGYRQVVTLGSLRTTNSFGSAFLTVSRTDDNSVMAHFSFASNGDFSAEGNIHCPGSVTARRASDERLKINLHPLNGASKILAKLKPISYEYNELAHSLDANLSRCTEFGLSAQETQKVIPSMVSAMWEKYLGITYEKAVPWLIAGHNEHTTEIEKLQKEVARLKKEVKQLKAA